MNLLRRSIALANHVESSTGIQLVAIWIIGTIVKHLLFALTIAEFELIQYIDHLFLLGKDKCYLYLGVYRPLVSY